ncbi:MAG TPA: cofactor-independent phosphoglycerate mutase [Bacillota bacterium]|nr:cofactor-independent phosphoglycerate mutase [Bacillota bacterium]
MKYLVILADGAADYPLSSLGDKTPLQVSHKPFIDQLAQTSELGLVQTVPEGMPPGSDVANLAVMGYDPNLYYTGRSPLEAVSIGVELSPTDVAFRCNLVTLSGETDYAAQTMIDYSSDEISTEEAQALIEAIAGQLNSSAFSFYSGFSYRHLLVWHQGSAATQLTPPHDISDRKIASYLPAGEGADLLMDLMQKSRDILKDHPVNQGRIARGLRPATSIWLWGQGKKPAIDSFAAKYRINGTVISAVDLIKGLGICAGLKIVEVPGATGNVHTNFRGKAEAALAAFRSGQDFVYLHVEAPDEAGHRGELENKIIAIEKIDSEMVGVILPELAKIDPEFRIMILPDHPTPLSLKTHTSDPVPYLIYRSTTKQPQTPERKFDETSARATGILREKGYQLMDRFINGD